jgi:NAD(P)-dependent dehydrogenase (short-subunit alcohol dehydrogenase family)
MLKNKAALITGGSKGIGFGIAESLVSEGLHVVLTSRHQDAVDQAATQLNILAGSNAVGLEADVRKLEDMEKSVQRVLDEYGQLDVLIANAGVGHFASIEDLTPEQWHEVIDINLTGVFNSVKAAIPALIKSQGYIITIASLAGTNFFPTGAAYNASKFGLVGFTQAIMLDLRYQGIKVSTIMPGSVATYFNNRIPTPMDAWKIQPEDIGQMVVDLLKMDPRTLPSKIEVRPSIPPRK